MREKCKCSVVALRNRSCPACVRPRSLTNAVKYAATGKYIEVQISVTADAASLVIAVVDDGTGLPPGTTEEQLMSDFGGAQLHSGGHHSREVGSSGLGLPICTKLAALLGGRLRVGNRGPPAARGTAFSLTLPLAALSPAAVAVRVAEPRGDIGGPPTRATPPGGGPLGLHVLVVDDSSLNRRVCAHFLAQIGCRASEADDGDTVIEALAAARRAGAPVDVVLMDIHMARVNGDAACRALRAAGERLPVIAVRGLGAWHSAR